MANAHRFSCDQQALTGSVRGAYPPEAFPGVAIAVERIDGKLHGSGFRFCLAKGVECRF